MEYKVNLAVVDTETGGLSPSKNPLIEIACYPINENLVELKPYSSPIIAPYDDNLVYNDQALKVNGTSMNQIENGESSKIVCKEFVEYLKSLKKGRNLPILIGHNLKFDIGFLEAFLSFHKKDLWSLINKEFQIDTMWWGRMKWPSSINYKLMTCCDNAGIELVNAHRAMSDTQSTKDLVKYFIRNLRSQGTQTEKKEEQRFRTQFQF